MARGPGTPRWTRWRAWSTIILVSACLIALSVLQLARSNGPDDDGPPTAPGTAQGDRSPTPGEGTRLPGAMAGVDLGGLRDEELLDDLVDAAEGELDRVARPRQPFEASSVDDPFVDDALAAYTLALAGHATDDDRFREAAADIVDAWVSTTRTTRGTCTDSGSCQTSLVLSRAAPGLVLASDLLEADGRRSPAQRNALHRWLRTVALPAASRRDNNWGDAGTYLRAVAAAELGDEDELHDAYRQWRHGIDLIAADGHIPEETRRGKAGLMYTQEALSYKVAVAELLERFGYDPWAVEGKQDGSLRGALDVAARAMLGEDEWRWHDGNVREPSPAPLWALAADRWPEDRRYAELAASGEADNGSGHSAIIWTMATSRG